MVVNAAGDRLDEVPLNIARDPRRRDAVVENALSCFGCHGTTGLLRPRETDEVPRYTDTHIAEFLGRELLEIESSYPRVLRPDVFTSDSNRYRAIADTVTGGGPPKGDTEYTGFVALVGQYESNVGLPGRGGGVPRGVRQLPRPGAGERLPEHRPAPHLDRAAGPARRLRLRLPRPDHQDPARTRCSATRRSRIRRWSTAAAARARCPSPRARRLRAAGGSSGTAGSSAGARRHRRRAAAPAAAPPAGAAAAPAARAARAAAAAAARRRSSSTGGAPRGSGGSSGSSRRQHRRHAAAGSTASGCADEADRHMGQSADVHHGRRLLGEAGPGRRGVQAGGQRDWALAAPVAAGRARAGRAGRGRPPAARGPRPAVRR